MQEQNETNLNRAPVWRAFRAAAPQTLPVFAGYLVLGLGYGIYVQSLGLPVWLPPLMGTVVYGGSLEFVLASLLLGSFAPVSAFLMALMIQARHLFYGLTMLQRYRGYGLRSAYMIFAMSDETFSITCSAEPPEGVDKGWFMFFITLLDQIYWVASAAMGAALGAALQHRGRRFRHDGHVRGHLPQPVGKGKTARQRHHRHCRAAGLPAHLRLRRLPHPLDGLHPCGTAAAPPSHRGQRKRGGKMSNIQFILTIAVCAAATMLTRFLPFLVFGSRGGKVPEVVEYLGHVLPAAIFGMLIVYCLKGVSLTSGSHGIPEAIAIGVTVALHKWKHQTLVSIAGGTLCYVLLVQMVF